MSASFGSRSSSTAGRRLRSTCTGRRRSSSASSRPPRSPTAALPRRRRASGSTASCWRSSPVATPPASARASSSTSSPGRRPAGSTASTSRRRSRTTGRRTRCATSGSSAATSRCCCAGPSWLPALLKVPLLLAGAVKKPVLKGDAIAQWMYDALRDMDAAGSQPAELETLMPPSHPLELFVTVTDFYGYRRDVVIADPKLIGERAHRHVLSFRLGDGVDQFDEAHNGALAFSARTTMSFPGAFPPVSLASFQAAVAKEAGDVSPVLPELFRIYELSHADPHATFFIDGGVLDNKPFGHAIAAIKRRAAESEVERRLLYLEPDPGGGGGAAPGGSSPSPIATVLASISGLPRQEPVLDDILEVNRHNERVRRIRDIIETSFDPIRAADRGDRRHRARPAHAASSRRPSVAQWRTRINEDAKAAAGFALRDLHPQQGERRRRQLRADDLPPLRLPGRLQPGGVRPRRRPLLGGDAPLPRRERPAGSRRRPGRVPADVRPRLPRAPAALRDRRPQRVVRATPASPATRRARSSTRASACCGRRASCCVDAMDGRKLLTNITADVLAVFAQAPIDACDRRAARGRRSTRPRTPTSSRGSSRQFGKALDAKLAGTAEALYRQLFGLSEGWAPERRADLLVRYLGFPYWDVLLYPLQSVADAGERDTIEVVRMSPRDAKLLPPLDPRQAEAARRLREDALRRLLRPRRPRERLPLGPPRRRRAPDRPRARGRTSPTTSARPGAARRSPRSSRRRTARSRTPSRSSTTRAASPARSSACIAMTFGAQWSDGSRPSGDLAEEVVGAVGAERVHEGAGLDVAVGAGEGAAVEVAGAAREGERAVDDPGGRLVDERLRGLGLGEQRARAPRRVPSDAGLAARCWSISAAARDRTPREAARSTALSATCIRGRRVAVDAPGDACAARAASADSAMPSEAEAWNSPATRLRSMYGSGSPARKPPRTRGPGSSTPSKRDGVAARGAHAERVPVVVDDDAGRVGGTIA